MAVTEYSLPEEWRRRIARELENGEKLLWGDQPDPTMAMCRRLPVLGGLMCVVAVLIIGVAWIGWNGIRAGNVATIIPLALLFAAMGTLIFVTLRHRSLARKTCYALTSHRALVYEPNFVGKLKVTSYFPEQLAGARFERWGFFGPDAGDWVFRQQITKHTRIETYQNMPAPTKIDVSYSRKTFGFLNLKNGSQVERLLQKVAGR